ncbi:MAG: hypothetical protein AN483_07110 [Aphanizomenon flos-aquae MDT14a]|jgi:hypothetical protein|uniref:Uncharacterized protein n=1 Tax=Aphanizomenon flos-aquae WA102 TaxID=1710896 RepID=A0A1B7X2I2_APHFL|nr:MAG: hypothetical protein AN483_07110 [Aphanizomenon flos-aquae MDT14a]OBQ43586.1 MAG: hypothetical protein AN484_11640 [Aphanizomenon flos-aquae WA102]
MARSYDIADVKVGYVIDGLGKVEEIYSNGNALQFKIDGNYYHERVVTGTLKLAYNKKEITPGKLAKIVNSFTNSDDIKNSGDSRLIKAKKLIDVYFEIKGNTQTYVKHLGWGLSSVNAEFKFLYDQGFYREAVGGFVPKNAFFKCWADLLKRANRKGIICKGRIKTWFFMSQYLKMLKTISFVLSIFKYQADSFILVFPSQFSSLSPKFL